MRWQAILLGVVASWASAAQAATAVEPADRQAGTEALLPWIGWKIEIEASLLEKLPVYCVLLDLRGQTIAAYDLSDLTSFDRWYDIPEIDQ